MKDLGVCVTQMKVVPGRPDINVAYILNEIDDAKRFKADIIVFPEMCVSGYMIGDMWEDEGFVKECASYNEIIKSKSKGIVVVWGNVDIDETRHNEDGRIRKYNAAFIAENGEWGGGGPHCKFNKYMPAGRIYKTLLPNYRMFDDERYFHSLRQLAEDANSTVKEFLKYFPTIIRGDILHIGLTLCEDMWHQDYVLEPNAMLAERGADIIINISCSPWTWKKNDKRHRVVRDFLKRYPMPFIYCNNVGIQNNGKNVFVFDGSSTIYKSDGDILDMSVPYINATKHRNVLETKYNFRTDFPDDENKMLHDALVYGIQEYFELIKKKRVFIGLSGGIDSAVDAALLVKALGKENVVAVNMPYKYNSDTTKNAAKQLANNFGIEYIVQPIYDAVDLRIRQLEDLTYTLTDLVKENIQAIERGAGTLRAIAAANDAVFINNGNKTELAFGYCTMYGDTCGVLSPLGDVYKWEVYQLAKYINERIGKNGIPEVIINLKPSAELSSNQNVDEGKGDPFYYEMNPRRSYHDQLVKALIEFRISPEDILEMYLNKTLDERLNMEEGVLDTYFRTKKDFYSDLKNKCTLIKNSYFKRIQFPPVICVSKRAFGYDLREAILPMYFTKRFLELGEQLEH